MIRSVRCGVLAACLLSGCDNGTLQAFEPQALGVAGSSGSDNRGGSTAGSTGGTSNNDAGGEGGSSGLDGRSGSTTGGGTETGGTETGSTDAGGEGGSASSPLLIDDFEDGDTVAQKPLGYWYPVNDGVGTQGFGVEPVSRGLGSVYALQSHGSGFQKWGAAVGVDLAGQAPSLNALGYARLCFVARVDTSSNTLVQVHFIQRDQHYTEDVSLSETWTRYCRPLDSFVNLTGEPLVPSELLALQFFFAPGSPFGFWLDKVELTP